VGFVGAGHIGRSAIPYSQEIFHVPFDQKKSFLFLSSHREGFSFITFAVLLCERKEIRRVLFCFVNLYIQIPRTPEFMLW
jgi:hypothetical protein